MPEKLDVYIPEDNSTPIQLVDVGAAKLLVVPHEADRLASVRALIAVSPRSDLEEVVNEIVDSFNTTRPLWAEDQVVWLLNNGISLEFVRAKVKALYRGLRQSDSEQPVEDGLKDQYGNTIDNSSDPA